MLSKICSIADCHGSRESWAPTQGCASIASNTPEAMARIASRGSAPLTTSVMTRAMTSSVVAASSSFLLTTCQ